MRAPRPMSLVAALLPGRCPLFVQQLEALIGEGMQPDVLPGAQPLRGTETERLTRALRLDRERTEHIGNLRRADTPVESHGAEMVAVQAPRELGQQRVLGIGSDALDHELLPRYAQREGGPLLQELLGPTRHARGRGSEGGMALRIHGMFVERDRQLDEKIG